MEYTCTYKSELGNILLAADEIGLTGLWFEGQKYFANKNWDGYDEGQLIFDGDTLHLCLF